jgi:chromosome segregation ATPase
LSLGKEKLSEKEAELESVKTELTSYYKQRSELEQENQSLKEAPPLVSTIRPRTGSFTGCDQVNQ